MSGFNYGYGMYNGMPQIQPQPTQSYQRGFIPPFNQGSIQNDFQERMLQGMKIVESEKSVENIDIPMDGNVYYFLKADGSEIYSKFWTREMKTQVNKFILYKDEEVKEDEKPTLDEMLKNYFETLDKNISNRIDSVNENILSLNKPVQNKVNKNVKEA